MLYPFFALAAQSPGRQRTFRNLVVMHVLLLAGASWGLLQTTFEAKPLAHLGHIALIAGIVEGAALVGWRLVQLPKSQALEFLLVSPLRPGRVLFAEAMVGLTRLGLVTLAGFPVLAWLAAVGHLDPADIPPLLSMPFTWGAITGLGLTVWAYEPLRIRRWGERAMMLLILVYLVVGVLAGENLKNWLHLISSDLERWVVNGFEAFHRFNPFAVLLHWLENADGYPWEAMIWLEVGALFAAGLFLLRSMGRLQGHYHDLHYQPAVDRSGRKRRAVGERPLAWWAVKRVMNYSGRINLWLIGGFGILYAAYAVAGDFWPPWMGRRVFELCDQLGGLAGLATGLVVLAAVPAAFQYGLWDANAQDRCRRLELLLLTRLQARDYWDAASAAAWRRGRGYFAVAVLMWLAAAFSGRADVAQILAAIAVGVLLWSLYFALGFRAFSRGIQTNGLGMLLTLGLPLFAYVLHRAAFGPWAALLPPGGVYSACVGPLSWTVLAGAALCALATLAMAREALAHCDRDLRRWYDLNHGRKVMT
ncbi:MAG TPA: hypothetical protein VGG61_07765 [Gemmataceae bacterium]|jgi:hypothetical protein